MKISALSKGYTLITISIENSDLIAILRKFCCKYKKLRNYSYERTVQMKYYQKKMDQVCGQGAWSVKDTEVRRNEGFIIGGFEKWGAF